MNKLLKYIIFFLLGIIVYYFLFNNPDLGAKKLIEGFITNTTDLNNLIKVPIYLKTNYEDSGTGSGPIDADAVGNAITPVTEGTTITIPQMFQSDAGGISLNKDFITFKPEESIFFKQTTYYDNNTSPTSTTVTSIAEGNSDGSQPVNTVNPLDIDHLKINGVIPTNITMSYLLYSGNYNDDLATPITLENQSSLPASGLTLPSNMSDQDNMLLYYDDDSNNALVIQFNFDSGFPDKRNLPTDEIIVYFKLTLGTNINGFTRVRSSNEAGDDTISKTDPVDPIQPSVITGTLTLDNINELTQIRRIYEKFGGQEPTQNISILLNTNDYNNETITLSSGSILSIGSSGNDNEITYNPLTIDLFFYSFFIINTEVERALSNQTAEDELKYAELLNIIFLGTGEGGRFSSLTGCGDHAQMICEEINETYSKDGSKWVPKDPANFDQNCIPTKTGPLRALTGGQTCFENSESCCKDISCSTVFFGQNQHCGDRLSLPDATCDLERMEGNPTPAECMDSCCATPITDISRTIFNDIREFSKKVRVHNLNTIRMSDIHNYIIYHVINIEDTFDPNANQNYEDLNTDITLVGKTLSDSPLTTASSAPSSNITDSDFDVIKHFFSEMVTNPTGGSLIQINSAKVNAIILRTFSITGTSGILEGLFTGGLQLRDKFLGVDGTEQFEAIQEKYNNFYQAYIQGENGGSALHTDYDLERTIKENVILLSHRFSDSLNSFEGNDSNPLIKYSSLNDDAEISLSRFQLLL